MATLIVRRRSQWVDRVRSYRLLVDGLVVGSIARNAEVRVPLTVGQHTLVAEIDWCRSGELAVTFRDDQDVVTVEVGNSMATSHLLIPFSPLVYVTFLRSSYLYLRPEPRGFPVLTADSG